MPWWLKLCLAFMATSFPPLTDSLESSGYIHKDSSVAAATVLGVSELGIVERVREKMGSGRSVVWQLTIYKLRANHI